MIRGQKRGIRRHFELKRYISFVFLPCDADCMHATIILSVRFSLKQYRSDYSLLANKSMSGIYYNPGMLVFAYQISRKISYGVTVTVDCEVAKTLRGVKLPENIYLQHNWL